MTPMNLLLLWTKLDMANDEIESVCYVNALFPFVRAVYRWHTTEIPKKNRARKQCICWTAKQDNLWPFEHTFSIRWHSKLSLTWDRLFLWACWVFFDSESINADCKHRSILSENDVNFLLHTVKQLQNVYCDTILNSQCSWCVWKQYSFVAIFGQNGATNTKKKYEFSGREWYTNVWHNDNNDDTQQQQKKKKNVEKINEKEWMYVFVGCGVCFR